MELYIVHSFFDTAHTAIYTAIISHGGWGGMKAIIASIVCLVHDRCEQVIRVFIRLFLVSSLGNLYATVL